MSSQISEKDVFVEWLTHRLLHERELLARRHDTLVQEFQALRNRQEHHIKLGQSHEDADADPDNDFTSELQITSPNAFKQVADQLAQNGDPDNDFTSELQITSPNAVKQVAHTNLKDMRTQDLIAMQPDPGTSAQPTPDNSDATLSKQSPAPKHKAFFRSKDKATTANSLLTRLVVSHRFELFFAVMIGLNMVVMALEMQYTGLGVGYNIQYPGYSESKEQAVPSGREAFITLGWFFGIMYTAECVLKMCGLGRLFFEKWNVFDLFVVLTFYFEKVAVGVTFPVDTMILRLFRLVKVLRLLRLVHELAGLEQLLLMVTALKGSMKMLCWATLLLFGCLTTFAFLFNQLTNGYIVENHHFGEATRLQCFKYFGTFSRAIFSMFELTLGNWIIISRFLIEDVHEYFVWFALLYKLTLGFAVVGVVNACFIRETFKIVSTDRHMMVIDKNNQTKSFVREMLRFIAHADQTNDGRLTQEEFMQVCKQDVIKAWWGAQGLDVTDAPQLFKLMDDGSGELSAEELVKGVARLKGPSRSLDVATNRLEMLSLEIKVLQHIAQLETRLPHKIRDVHAELNSSPTTKDHPNERSDDADLRARGCVYSLETLAQHSLPTNFQSSVEDGVSHRELRPPHQSGSAAKGGTLPISASVSTTVGSGQELDATDVQKLDPQNAERRNLMAYL